MIWFDLHSALEFTDKEGKRKRRVEDKVPRSRTRSCFVIFIVIVIFNIGTILYMNKVPSSRIDFLFFFIRIFNIGTILIKILTDIRSQDRLGPGV